MQGKPLYEAEQQIQYQRHLERLKKIANKKLTQSQNSKRPIQQLSKIRHNSSEYQVRQKNIMLNTENNKLLNKLLQISERTDVPSYSTIASHYVSKKPSSIASFNNPERKRRQQEIMQTNNKLAQRLLSKQSQFDRSKTIKSIQQYQNVRKILQNNRRVRLVPMFRQNVGYVISTATSNGNSNYNSRVDTSNKSRALELPVTSEVKI